MNDKQPKPAPPKPPRRPALVWPPKRGDGRSADRARIRPVSKKGK